MIINQSSWWMSTAYASLITSDVLVKAPTKDGGNPIMTDAGYILSQGSCHATQSDTHRKAILKAKVSFDAHKMMFLSAVISPWTLLQHG